MKKARQKQARRELTRCFFHKNHMLFIAALAVGIAINCSNLLFSYLIQRITDVAMGHDIAPLWRLLIITAVGIAAFFALEWLWSVVKPRFVTRAVRQYKSHVFTRLMQKSIASFQREGSAEYISALTNDIAMIERDYLPQLTSIASLAAVFFGSLAMMLYYSPLLTVAGVALSLLPMAVSVVTGSRLAVREAQVSQRNAGFVGMVKDLLSGFSVLKSFRAEGEAQRLFNQENAALEESKRARGATAQRIHMLGEGASILAQMGVFILGAYLAVTGQGVTPGVVILFVQLMNFVLSPMTELPPLLASRKAALALMDKLADNLNENVRDTGENIPPCLTQGIDVQNLTFAYPDGAPVLRDVSFRLEHGKSYAIVGASGSGKSTLLSLLMGASPDYQGQIRYDGHELRGISAESLYGVISLVQQNTFIFNDTILNNVTMFRQADPARVERALRLSGLSALIAQRGADTPCGENGSALSGGERQRVSIARALMQDAPVMLADEATAALDAQTARAVVDAILDIEGLTRVIVTHRMDARLMRRYDEILVLHGGTICEHGTFDDLMARRGMLYSLYTVSQADEKPA